MNTNISNIIDGKILCKNTDGSQLYGLTWKTLCKKHISNWKFNRPYDSTRIPEIVEQIKKQDYIDGIIYLASRENKIICYDGIHRIEALKFLQKENPDISHKIIIHYYPFYNEQLIKQKFETLNKCVPVPELYTSAHKELNIKNLIENIVKHYQNKYYNMFKASSKPNIPHENRDNFTDKILHIIQELELSDIDYNKFIIVMDNYNDFMREAKNNSKLSKKQIEKCDIYNCYLFIEKEWNFKFIRFYRKYIFK
jgi:hypothetical protein